MFQSLIFFSYFGNMVNKLLLLSPSPFNLFLHFGKLHLCILNWVDELTSWSVLYAIMHHYPLCRQSKIGHKPQSDIGVILWEELNLAAILQELACCAGIQLIQFLVIWTSNLLLYLQIFFFVNTTMSTNN